LRSNESLTEAENSITSPAENQPTRWWPLMRFSFKRAEARSATHFPGPASDICIERLRASKTKGSTQMEIIPSLSPAIANVTAYQILAEPLTFPTASSPQVESVRLTASSWGAAGTEWSISFEQLSSSLMRIIGKATTAEVLQCLRVGQVMRLPGTYNSYELIRLGYRKRFERTNGSKLKAGAR
jgi:hypothetical protein